MTTVSLTSHSVNRRVAQRLWVALIPTILLMMGLAIASFFILKPPAGAPKDYWAFVLALPFALIMIPILIGAHFNSKAQQEELRARQRWSAEIYGLQLTLRQVDELFGSSRVADLIAPDEGPHVYGTLALPAYPSGITALTNERNELRVIDNALAQELPHAA